MAVRTILAGEEPAYLRLPRMQVADLPGDAAVCRWLLSPQNLNFVSTGLATQLALEAARALEQHGIASGLLHCARVSPLPRQVRELTAGAEPIVVVEDHYSRGGLASLIREIATSRVTSIGWPNSWPGKSGSELDVLESQGLGRRGILERVLVSLRERAAAWGAPPTNMTCPLHDPRTHS